MPCERETVKVKWGVTLELHFQNFSKMIIFFTGAFSYPCLSSSLTLYLFSLFLAISHTSSTVSSRLVIFLSPILTGREGGREGGRAGGGEGGRGGRVKR